MSSPPKTRCKIHDAVLSPEGLCVLCRSRNPEERPTHWGLLVLGLTVTVIAFGAFTRIRSPTDAALVEIDATVTNSKRIENTRHPNVANSVSVADENSRPSRFEHAAFEVRDPRGFRAELRARGESDLSGDYQAKDESFEIVLPGNIAEGDPVGLLVWISASQSGALPKSDWAPVLAANHLAFIGPNRAGNEREIASRLGLALDSVLAARRRINVDTRRLFIGGISGGAKTAFRALLYFPEVFHGALLCAGIETFRDVPIQAHKGSFWPKRIGVPSDLSLVKSRPVAITTGPKDYNFAQIEDVVTALGQDHFSHVATFERPELAHDTPPADLLEQALTWVDGLAK